MSNDQSVSEVVAAAAAADTSNCDSSSSEPLQHKNEEEGEIRKTIPQDLKFNDNSTIETETDIKDDDDDDDDDDVGKPPSKRAKVDMGVCGDDIANPNPLDLPANSSSTTTSSSTDNNNNNPSLPSIDNNNNENEVNNKGDTSNATKDATAVDADAVADATTGEEMNATTSDNTTAQGLLSPAMTRSRASSSDKGTGKDNETTHEPNEEPQERWRGKYYAHI
jgi:hypothetical protein